MDEKKQLMDEITTSIQEVAQEKELSKLNSLSRFAPERVAKLLYLYATGSSQTRLVKRYGFDRATVISVLTDYSDHIGKFRELSGKIAAKNYLDMSNICLVAMYTTITYISTSLKSLRLRKLLE